MGSKLNTAEAGGWGLAHGLVATPAHRTATHQGAIIHDELQLVTGHNGITTAALSARCHASAGPGQALLLLPTRHAATFKLLLSWGGVAAALDTAWGRQWAKQVGVDLHSKSVFSTGKQDSQCRTALTWAAAVSQAWRHLQAQAACPGAC